MSRRIWFTAENTSGLGTEDLRILNRAARNLFNTKEQSPTHARLSLLRTSYTKGMSASDLLRAIEQ